MNEPRVRVLQLYSPKQIRAELERVGADSSVASAAPSASALASHRASVTDAAMTSEQTSRNPSSVRAAASEHLARAQFFYLKMEHVSLSLARLLYQELVMEGGQVVTAPRLEHVGAGETDALLCATRYQFNHLVVRLRWQPSDELQWLAGEIERALDAFVSPPPALELGATRFDWSRTIIMGILNLTPDSFSGDGLQDAHASETETLGRVLQRAHTHRADGAAILDLGGESTHPNAPPVPVEIEMQRVLPAVRALKSELAVPLSIDTSKARVADAALNAGAQLVNDVTGLRGDAEMKRVVAAHNAPVVLVHNWLHRARPENVRDVMGVIIDELRAQIDMALGAGIPEKNILLDPGIGFGKTPNENLEILNRVGELRALGFPILVGPSRKGFISKTIDVREAERVEGTAAAISVAILRGANMVRVHDVKMMTRVARMTDAIESQSLLSNL